MKYMGSKSRIAKQIVPIIQNYIDQSTKKAYIEPFAGGFASQTTKGTPEIPRPSLLWLLSITGRR